MKDQTETKKQQIDELMGLRQWTAELEKLETDHKGTEETLKASELRFRRLFETAQDGILILNADTGMIEVVNPFLIDMLGYSHEELLRKKLWEIGFFKDIGASQSAFKELQEKEYIRYEDLPLETKKGRCMEVEFVSNVYEVDGKKVIQCNVRDITGRKVRKALLLENEKKYHQVMENVNDAILITQDGMIKFTNKRMNEISRYSGEELFSRPFVDFIHPDDQEMVSGNYQKRLRGESVPSIYSFRVIDKDGNIKWVETRSLPITWGSKPATLNFLSDITGHKQAEATLRDEREKLETVTQNMGAGLAIISKDYRTLWGNRVLKGMFGDVEGKICHLIYNKRNEICPGCGVREVFEKGSDRVMHEQVGKDVKGNTIWAEMIATPIKDQDGNITAALELVIPITERKQTEDEKAVLQEQLCQSQKMEAIGQLAGGVAHDFNNLLTVIKGYSQLSISKLQKHDPLWEYIQEISKAADRSSELTRQLLAFSRHQLLDFAVIDLNFLIQGTEKMLRRMIREDIELMIYLGENLGKIKVDSGQIEQVIVNLAVNAKDAMPSGGKLILETENVELDERFVRSHLGSKPGRYVRLSVTDTGCGMSKEVSERIFEPFFTTKENGKGTGLGLSTVYGIVKHCEGYIWVYSELGHGTTFKIYLPWVDETVEVLKEEVKQEGILQADETILVVEDNEAVRKLAVQILKKQGYEVLESPHGGDALLVCEGHPEPIHLVITDVVMPGIGGPELIERLRQVQQDFRVLYMSGYTNESVMNYGIKIREMDFIQKPFTVEGLARKVREVLDKA